MSRPLPTAGLWHPAAASRPDATNDHSSSSSDGEHVAPQRPPTAAPTNSHPEEDPLVTAALGGDAQDPTTHRQEREEETTTNEAASTGGPVAPLTKRPTAPKKLPTKSGEKADVPRGPPVPPPTRKSSGEDIAVRRPPTIPPKKAPPPAHQQPADGKQSPPRGPIGVPTKRKSSPVPRPGDVRDDSSPATANAKPGKPSDGADDREPAPSPGTASRPLTIPPKKAPQPADGKQSPPRGPVGVPTKRKSSPVPRPGDAHDDSASPSQPPVTAANAKPGRPSDGADDREPAPSPGTASRPPTIPPKKAPPAHQQPADGKQSPPRGPVGVPTKRKSSPVPRPGDVRYDSSPATAANAKPGKSSDGADDREPAPSPGTASRPPMIPPKKAPQPADGKQSPPRGPIGVPTKRKSSPVPRPGDVHDGSESPTQPPVAAANAKPGRPSDGADDAPSPWHSQSPTPRFLRGKRRPAHQQPADGKQSPPRGPIGVPTKRKSSPVPRPGDVHDDSTSPSQPPVTGARPGKPSDGADDREPAPSPGTASRPPMIPPKKAPQPADGKQSPPRGPIGVPTKRKSSPVPRPGDVHDGSGVAEPAACRCCKARKALRRGRLWGTCTVAWHSQSLTERKAKPTTRSQSSISTSHKVPRREPQPTSRRFESQRRRKFPLCWGGG